MVSKSFDDRTTFSKLVTKDCAKICDVKLQAKKVI